MMVVMNLHFRNIYSYCLNKEKILLYYNNDEKGRKQIICLFIYFITKKKRERENMLNYFE